MEKYDHKQIEEKWQKVWQESGIYKAKAKGSGKKCYVLNEFPYPSGQGLHVGHLKGHIATDIYSRYKRMMGFDVLHPMGWDAFGLPAENFAIKNKVHPRVAVDKNIATFKSQLSIVGPDYDWDREIDTTDPAYYKWTQWIFLQMYKKGLAYESNEPINWCPSCLTGLANEDLDGGKCERCGSTVVQKRIRQWVLRITDYAERLIDDLALLDWPESVKEQQREWIGKSDGLIFKAKVADLDLELETFTAHYEACYADTFVVIAPDHELLAKLIAGVKDEPAIRKVIETINVKRLEDKYSEGEVEGVFTGRYLIDPLTGAEFPIWVASYALADYGTGIVRCSAHDKRDFAFAKKYNIPLKVVLLPKEPKLRAQVQALEVCYSDMKHGELIEPLNLSGKSSDEVRTNIASMLIDSGFAKRAVKYRLRDWVFSRQRYWGEPIPLIHCDQPAGGCGVVPVPESDLPVVLPDIKKYEPTGTGESPLASIAKWVNVKCPKCAGAGKRETNTMPQWAGSSWYWLRFMDPHNSASAVSKESEKYWAPVDIYVGGAEHTTRHLIYARFWHKFLFDIKTVSTEEPFAKRIPTGLILATDGRKMSKRWDNVINPSDVVERFGADAFRLYEMFLGPFSESVMWNDSAIIGPRRFLEKLWRVAEKVIETEKNNTVDNNLGWVEVNALAHSVARDVEDFKFNTAVPRMMTTLNVLNAGGHVSRETLGVLLRVLAPFAPHITEELWTGLGHIESIHLQAWPISKSTKQSSSEIVPLPIHIDGKYRFTIYVTADVDEESVVSTALQSQDALKWTKGGKPKNTIYKPGKILSITM